MNDTITDSEAAFKKYEYAGAYHHALMDDDPFYIAKIQRAVSLVRRGAVVLDVGCGDGVFVKYACEVDAKVIGIDTSEEGVRLARVMTGSGELCVAAADVLPIRSSSLDVVVMIDVVNYLPDCEEAIREAARALRTNGILIVMSPCDVSLEAERADIDDSWQTHVWTVETLRVLIEKHLCVDDVSFIEKVVPPRILVVLARWIRATGLLGMVRRLVHVLQAIRPGVGRQRTAVSLPNGRDIVLNPLSLPRSLVIGREKLEFIIVARREDAAS